MRQRSPERRGCIACVNAFAGFAALLLAWGLYRNALPIGPRVSFPKPPAANGYDDFVRAGETAAGVAGIREVEVIVRRSAEVPPDLALRVARASGPVLSAVRAGLRKACACPPRRTWHDIIHEPAWPTAALAADLAAVAAARQAAGRADEAAEVALDAIEAGTRCTRGGGIGDYEAGDQMTSAGIVSLERALPRLPSAALSAAAGRLDRIAAERPRAVDVLRVEKAIVAVAQVDLSRARLGPVLWIGRCIPSLDPADDIRRQWRLLDQIAAECSAPYTRSTRIDTRVWRTSYLSARSLLIFRNRYFVSTTSFALLRAEVALYRFRAARGRWPGVLGQLVPAYLPAVPADPFGGSAGSTMRYRVTNGGHNFVLYSLGPDLRDDGGSLPRAADLSAGDLVAGRLYQIARRRR